MESVRVNLRMRDESGNVVRVVRADRVEALPASTSVSLGLILLFLLGKLLTAALVLL